MINKMQKNTPSQESLTERLNKRDQERKNVIEQRKEEKEHQAVEHEQSGYFKESFYSSCKKVKDTLDNVKSMPIANLPDIFRNLNKEIAVLKNYLFQSKIFLKVYDVRKAQEALQGLESEVKEAECKYIPRKKFGFKNRNYVKKTAEIAKDVADGIKNVNIDDNNGSINGIQKEKNSHIYNQYSDNTCILSGKLGEQLVLDEKSANKKDILLSDLTRCSVKVYGAPMTVHLINLDNCTVLVGPVTTSVFIEKCRECQFVIACQQVRLHSSNYCTIYQHVTSRAIIEDSKEINFAPYNWTYENQISHFDLAGLDPNKNNWDCIDDFNWLCPNKRSPNWAILRPELRVNSWD